MHQTKMYEFRTLITIIVFLLMPLSSVFGQLRELEITPAQASGSIPVFTNHPEMAAVIINSSISGLQFDSNVGIVEELSRPNDGYYVLIVRPWRQIITVTAPGFRQSRFTVSASQAREVLYYGAEPQQATGNLIPVNIVVTPSNANIYVNDQVMEAGRTNQLTAGSHALRIERNGFRTIEQVIQVSSQNTLFTYQMQEVQVTQVIIRSEPNAATLFVDDINVGATTYANFVYPGVYNIRMMMPNYRTLETQITVEEDGQNQFHFTLERFASELQLSVVPANARVFINRQDYSGQSRIILAPGRYRLDIEADGFERFSEQIELLQNQPLVQTVNLNPLTGNLQFSVRPVDASAVLTNSRGEVVEQWQSLRIIRNLPVGTYSIAVQYPGHQAIRENITITEGQTVQFDRTLLNLNPGAAAPVQNPPISSTQPSQNQPANRPANNPPPPTNQTPTSPPATTTQTPTNTGAAQRPTSTTVASQMRAGPTRGGAVTRSLFIPGAGQIYARKGRGYLYFAAFAGSGTYAYLANQGMADAEKSKKEALQLYNRASSISTALMNRQEVEKHARKERDAYGAMMLGLQVAAGVYGLQLLDSMVMSTGGSGTNSRFQAGFTAEGVSVRIPIR